MTLEEAYRLSCYEELTALDYRKRVYLVKNKENGEIFVKKELEKFSKEVYKKLQHEKIAGIPEIHEIIEEEDRLILVEEYIHGKTLEKLLSERGVLPEEEVRDIAGKVCTILKQLHNLKPSIIHRDLKPSNVMINPERTVYFIDFNTARYYEDGRNRDTKLLGTENYAAPEQYGFGQSDERSDIYAFGVMINKLLTGGYPRDGKPEGSWGDIISKCTRWEPEERYQTVQQLEMAVCGKREDKISYRIPGFRSRTPWKMLVGIGIYGMLAWICFTMKLVDTDGKSILSGVRLWYERTFSFLTALALIFYGMDFGGIRARFFDRYVNHPLLRGLIWVGCGSFLVFFMTGLMLIIEWMIW
jgi:serine/threonine protein kinase